MSFDPRIVAGALCSWWGPVGESVLSKPKNVGSFTDLSDPVTRIPVCPFCGSPLLEWANIDHWNESVRGRASIELADPEDRLARTEWMRGRCFRDLGSVETLWRERCAEQEAAAIVSAAATEVANETAGNSRLMGYIRGVSHMVPSVPLPESVPEFVEGKVYALRREDSPEAVGSIGFVLVLEDEREGEEFYGE